MPSRRQIREAVVQFLYCADLEGGADPAELREAFWQFVTESDRRALVIATWKTLRHLAAGREERHEEFLRRLPVALDAIAGLPELEHASRLLERIATLEHEWSSRLHALATLRRDDEPDLVTRRFSDGIDLLFSIDRDLSGARAEFLRTLDDHPAQRASLEPLAGPINRLTRISDRIQQLECPEHFPDQADLKKILSCRASLAELRQKADQLADAVLREKTGIDARLDSVIENFAPERIDPIDRAILRLGTWEILHDPEVPAAVAINEAVELAKTFGTTDSGRFVNGILDRIAKSQASVQAP